MITNELGLKSHHTAKKIGRIFFMRSTQVNWKAYAITSFILANFPRQYPWEFMVCFLPLGVTGITIRISKGRLYLMMMYFSICLVDSHA